ncbi:TPA: hypothetical protein U4A27_000943 [Enterococcus faecium]|nr:hypothetical protein [Enterococcus faecium]
MKKVHSFLNYLMGAITIVAVYQLKRKKQRKQLLVVVAAMIIIYFLPVITQVFHQYFG